MRIEDPRVTEKGRQEYNRIVKEACRWEDEANMKSEMEKMKKMKTMSQQGLEMKEYVKTGTLYSARKTWQVRSSMLDQAGNFPNQVQEINGKMSGVQLASEGRAGACDKMRRIPGPSGRCRSRE